MDHEIFKAEDNKYRLIIYQDGSPDDPRNWDNLGTMVCGHKRYNLGDEQAERTDEYTSWDEWFQHEVLDFYQTFYNDKNAVLYLPLYLYDHSNISMNTSGFYDRWDSGQVGYIYVTKEKVEEEGLTEEQAYRILEEEVKIYNMYLSVEVYGFRLEKKKVCDCCGSVDYTYKDSCWSIYADSLKELKQLIRGYLPVGTEYLLDMLEKCY